ncbi:MAG: SBBP repeat-containing protein [Elusimicrobia bacterium]|nr:SBBP repeat-containing protein [Elusimicrobiota bacterium]
MRLGNRLRRILITGLIIGPGWAGSARAGELILQSTSTYNSGGADKALAAATNDLDELFVAGSAGDDSFLVKYNVDLLALSSAVYNGGDVDAANGVAADDRGHVYLAGNSGGDFLTLRYDTDLLQPPKSASYDGGSDDAARAVAFNPKSGEIIVTGESANGSDYNILTIRYDHDLNVLSSATFSSGGNEDKANDVAVDSQGNIYVAGQANNTGNSDFLLLKYDRNLNRIGMIRYDGGGNDIAQSVAVDAEDNVFVTGQSAKGATIDFVTLKYDKSLALAASAAYDGGGDDIAHAVAIDNMGNAIVAGRRYSSNDFDVFSIRYDNALAVVSSAAFNSAGKDIAYGLATDSRGSIILCGESSNDWLVRKYRGTPVVYAVSQARQGETLDLTVNGVNFSSGTALSFSSTTITVHSVRLVNPEQFIASVTVSGTEPLGKKSAVVTNADGTKYTAAGVLEVVRKKTLDPAANETMTSTSEMGLIQVDVPAGTFSASLEMTLTVPEGSAFPSVNIRLSPALTPQKDVTLTLGYRDGDVQGLDETLLTLVRYDESRSEWVVLSSTPSPAVNRVSGTTNHFSLFAIRGQAPVPADNGNSGDAEVETENVFVYPKNAVYPNPYKPGSTDFGDPAEGKGIVFSRLPARFKLRVFNTVGELVFEREGVSAGGKFLWDTRGNEGSEVASGVYIYWIQDPDSPSSPVQGKIAVVR